MNAFLARPGSPPRLHGALCLLLPCLAAASQCPPQDICRITAKVLSVEEAPADELGLSLVRVRLRVLTVGEMVEKSRFTPPAATCAHSYRRGQKLSFTRFKGGRKDPDGHDGIAPGTVLRGEVQYGCDERTSWHSFENYSVLGSTRAAAGRPAPGPGPEPALKSPLPGPKPTEDR